MRDRVRRGQQVHSVSIFSLMRKRIRLVTHAGLAILSISHPGFAQLPSQYNLRDVNGLSFVTSVQNQGGIGTCWTWAGMQAVESDLFKQGLLPVTSQLQQPAISAWHMATANGNPELLEWNPQKEDYEATNGGYNWGGNTLDTIGYLTRGSGSWNSVGAVPGLTTTEMGGGPVMIQTNAKNSYNLEATAQHLNLGPFVPPANQPMAYLPTSIVDLDFKDRQTSAKASGLSWDAADQVAAVKAAVEKYGAVYTTMYVPPNSNFTPYLGTDGWYHYYYNGTAPINHAVAIVGWDNSLTFEGAPSPGGYIVQNSWGTDWGGSGQGLFYASYNDANIGKLGATAYQFSPMGRFSGLVLQNQVGPNFSTAPAVGAMGLSWIGNSHGNQEAVSVLTNNNTNSYLGGIGVIGQYGNQSIRISLYTGMSASGPIGLLPNEAISATLPAPGYFLFNLNPYLLNENQKIVVEVQYLNNALGGFVDSIPVEGIPDGLDGLSYIWNGSRWEDLGPKSEVFFLKGYLLLGLNTYTGAILANSYYNYSTGQQVSYIPTTGDFYVNGYASTSANNVVIHNLQFADSSFLQLSDNLMVNGGVISVDTGTSAISGGTLSVPGNLALSGSGTLWANTNLYVGGQVTIDGATLGVSQQTYVAGNSVVIEKNGALLLDGGTVISDTQNAGRIAGTGTIVGNVSNFGDVVPNAAPGTLKIAGNYVQAAGGSLDIEVVGPQAYGLLAIAGNANLGGVLNVWLSSGYKIAYGQILSDFVTADRVNGSFEKVVMPDNYRGRVLEDATTVSLLVAPASYTQLAQNPNQHSVAKGLDAFIAATQGDEYVVSLALDHLSFEQYPLAFNAIMASFYQTASSIGLSIATTEAQLIDQKIGSKRLDADGVAALQSGNLRAYDSDDANGKSSVEPPTAIIRASPYDHAEMWFQGEGVFGNRYSVANLPSYRYSSGVFLVGADYRWDKHFKTGIFAGYQAVDARYPENGQLRVNGVTFGGYATFDPGDGIYANLIAIGGYDSYTAKRPIEFGSIDRVAHSDFDSGNGGIFFESGYDFKVNTFTVGPVANAQYTYLGVTPFTEDNAGSLDLRVDRQDANSFQTNIGARIAYTWRSQGEGRIIPECRIFWNHEYLQGAGRIRASLDGGGGPYFGYTTTPLSRDSAFAAIGVNAQFGSRWNVALYYNLQFGSATSVTNIVSADIGLTF